MRKSKPNFKQIPHGPVDHALAHFVMSAPLVLHDAARIGIAYSGGADSTALLWAACRLWPKQVYALHIHHGLQDAAEDFLKHCQTQCELLEVPLITQHVNAQNKVGESPEDAARNSRYHALSAMAKEEELNIVLLGQHLDDQIETLLLALSRGSGLPGLACMPALFLKDGVQYARPMLGVEVDELKCWLKANDITWVEDPTNQERIYTRNQIRLDVLPAIAQAFPSYKQTFARSIEHIVQAQELIDELAAQDLAEIGCPPVIKKLQQLSTARQSNLIRHWLSQAHHTVPQAKQLSELLKQITACQTRGHKINLKIGAGKVERLGDTLAYQGAEL